MLSSELSTQSITAGISNGHRSHRIHEFIIATIPTTGIGPTIVKLILIMELSTERLMPIMELIIVESDQREVTPPRKTHPRKNLRLEILLVLPLRPLKTFSRN
jgi:hypothetical protein